VCRKRDKVAGKGISQKSLTYMKFGNINMERKLGQEEEEEVDGPYAK